MGKPVILTPIAENDLEQIFIYLIADWGFEVANDFSERLENVKHLLSENPGIFPYYIRDRQIQKCVVTKHNVLYFQEAPTSIRVLTIFDTRQDPNKLKEIL